MVGTRVSHFLVLEKLGEGGIGAVYKAQDQKLDRWVALKILRPDLLPGREWRRRFLREARAAAAVVHPNIAAIHDVGEQDDTVFLVMEYVEGKTLRALLRERRLPLPEALRLGTAIAAGISRAHQSGVVHHDLKPENVIVDSAGEPKILDFGLAKLLEERSGTGDSATATTARTGQGRIMGTAAYMSPEQARGDAVDARSDVFSLGVVLYEMVTGEQPFTRPTWAETLAPIIASPTPSARAVNSEVPPELEWILGKCLEKSPAERYQDTRDLVVDLRRLRREGRAQPRPMPAAAGMEQLEPGKHRRARVAAFLWWSSCLALVGAIVATAWLMWQRTRRAPEPKLTRLTTQSLELSLRDGVISPDGRYLAYGDFAGLQLQRIDTGEVEHFPLPEDWSVGAGLDWFPDGSHLLVPAERSEGGKRAFGRFILSIPSGEAKRIHVPSMDIRVSPDGSLLAVDAPDSEGAAIVLTGLDGQERRTLRTALKWPTNLVWSPSGERLAYLNEQPDGSAIVESCDLTGQDVRTLLTDPALHRRSWLVWLRDGRLLYDRKEPAPRDRELNLWSIRVDARAERPKGSPQRVTSFDGVSDLKASASTDGKRLVALKGSRLEDVYLCEVQRGRPGASALERLTFDQRVDLAPEWTSDSARIFFMSDRAGSMDIYTQSIHDRNAESVVAGPGDEKYPTLSPDGRFLLYLVHEPGDSKTTDRLMRMSLSGGPSERVMDVRSPVAFVRCARRPGAPCILGEKIGGELVLSTFDPLVGRGREMARLDYSTDGPRTPRLWGWDLSPDGTRIAAAFAYPARRIRILQLAGGEPGDIPLTRAPLQLAWSFDGLGLFVTTEAPATEESNPLLWIDAAGKTETLSTLDGGMGLCPRASPDGRHLALVLLSFETSAWLIEDF